MKNSTRLLSFFLGSAMVLVLSQGISFAQEGSSSPTYDFTFKVPVELRNLPPQFVQGAVIVMVFASESEPDPEHGIWGESIGDKMVEFPITYGVDVDTVVTVAFNADPYKQPGSALYYFVDLFLGGYPAAHAMRLDGPYPYDQSKPFVPGFWDYLPTSRPYSVLDPNKLELIRIISKSKNAEEILRLLQWKVPGDSIKSKKDK